MLKRVSSSFMDATRNGHAAICLLAMHWGMGQIVLGDNGSRCHVATQNLSRGNVLARCADLKIAAQLLDG